MNRNEPSIIPMRTQCRPFFPICLLLVASVVFASQLVSAREEAPRPFERLERCSLIPNEANDGDSFHVRAKGKEYIFRLYFVDTPETENRFPERVQAQAKYFGITPDEAIRIGKIAAAFTRDKLAPKTFTVYTRWQDARGESRLPRYYALVVVEDKQLAELLVANGLARVFGQPANLPTGMHASAFEASLRTLEAKAKQNHLGAWSIHAPASAKQPESSWEKRFPNRATTPAP